MFLAAVNYHNAIWGEMSRFFKNFRKKKERPAALPCYVRLCQPSTFSTAASGALRRTESMPFRQEALDL